MDNIFSFIKYLATSNLINFLIMLGILAWIVKKIDLSKILQNAIKNVETKINNSIEKKSQSENQLSQMQIKKEKLPEKIKEFQTEIDTKADYLKQQINSDTKTELVEINSNIDKSVSLEEKKISNIIKETVVENSMCRAKEKIIEMLKNNPNLHEKFIDESLEDFERVNIK